MIDIWEACKQHIRPETLSGELFRIVESQQQIATRDLVDDLDEQRLLEQMLEQSKPELRPELQSLHYLLATPFRYPPLKHGSRFGSRWEPSLFYGSRTKRPALAEAAYYRFVFWYGMKKPPASGRFLTQHTLFNVDVNTTHGLRLQLDPFDAYQHELTDAVNYDTTQKLGTSMRKFGIKMFEYISARDSEQGINIALFSPATLASSKPSSQQPWLCETRSETVTFNSPESQRVHHFDQQDFWINGAFPQPAT